MSKSKIAKSLDISRPNVIRIIKALKTKGLLIQHKAKSSHLAPAKEWVDLITDPELKGFAMASNSTVFASILATGELPTPNAPQVAPVKGCRAKVSESDRGVSGMSLYNNNTIKRNSILSITNTREVIKKSSSGNLDSDALSLIDDYTNSKK